MRQHVLVYQAAELISSKRPNCRRGTSGSETGGWSLAEGSGRAMGVVVRVFGETFLVPLYINWALLPAMLFEDAATVAQSIWFGDDRDRLHSLFLQRPRSRRP